ncbi:hypothetical protein FGO68_gene13425 [Halteria grandinella]|uniref:Uncharacterized protein n=1 Tax=Halteria grandinella TaxID=5974 RepID=A0A8J8NET1_HALGN|nr:hypothetical protein FGO68_gene13425 [Halteria grandinella]
MKNKEQDQKMKVQFREDIDSLSEQMKIAIEALDNKISGQLDLLEKRYNYNMDGVQKTVEAKFSKYTTQISKDMSQTNMFCQNTQQQIDMIAKKAEDLSHLVVQKLTPMENFITRVKNQVQILNQYFILSSEVTQIDSALSRTMSHSMPQLTNRITELKNTPSQGQLVLQHQDTLGNSTNASSPAVGQHMGLVRYFDHRDYTVDFLKGVQRKLLQNVRRLIEENNPYNLLHEELVKEFFDPLLRAQRFERSQNISSMTLGGHYAQIENSARSNLLAPEFDLTLTAHDLKHQSMQLHSKPHHTSRVPQPYNGLSRKMKGSVVMKSPQQQTVISSFAAASSDPRASTSLGPIGTKIVIGNKKGGTKVSATTGMEMTERGGVFSMERFNTSQAEGEVRSKKNSPRTNSISEWGAPIHTQVISSLGLNDQNSRRFNIDLRGLSKSMMVNESMHEGAVTKHIVVQGNDRASSNLSFIEYNTTQGHQQQNGIATGFKSLSNSYDQSAQNHMLPSINNKKI